MSGSTTRLCWQRSPRSQPPSYSHNIGSGEELESLITNNADEKKVLLFFISDKHPHHRLIVGALERLATVYHPKLMFCIIDMTRLGDDIARPLAQKYYVDPDHPATAIIFEKGETIDTLFIGLKREKQETEDFIRDHLGLKRIPKPAFGFQGTHSYQPSGTTM
ncbi:hypothetical protein TWF730_009139 [Orbilia blumenaviensis]|uniref:Thioredoxin domain-containing protein n=1 Tax=Orbilia blumenaviensis TaxID=1796055 RepID=A0AAV9UYN8_9PEZI